ncbi:uncharacterized protein [Ptychodera flava]|uniref:uncharacterized protein n=1 Tax=Ptychodera flava TaxID=63121 RepID=UPI003969E8E8
MENTFVSQSKENDDSVGTKLGQLGLRVQKIDVAGQTCKDQRGTSPKRQVNMTSKAGETDSDSFIDFVAQANLPDDEEAVDLADKKKTIIVKQDQIDQLLQFIQPMGTYEQQLMHISRMTLNHRLNDPPTWKKLAERVINMGAFESFVEEDKKDKSEALPRSANISQRTIAWVKDPHDLEQERVMSSNMRRVIIETSDGQPSMQRENIAKQLSLLPIFHEKTGKNLKIHQLGEATKELPAAPSNSPVLSRQNSRENMTAPSKSQPSLHIGYDEILSQTSSMDITVANNRPNTSASQLIHRQMQSVSENNAQSPKISKMNNIVPTKEKQQHSLDFSAFSEPFRSTEKVKNEGASERRSDDGNLHNTVNGGKKHIKQTSTKTRLNRSTEEIITIKDVASATPLSVFINANVSESFPPINAKSSTIRTGSPTWSNQTKNSDSIDQKDLGSIPQIAPRDKHRIGRSLIRQRSLDVIPMSDSSHTNGTELESEVTSSSNTPRLRSCESLSSLPPVESYLSQPNSGSSTPGQGVARFPTSMPRDDIAFPSIPSPPSNSSNPKTSGQIVARRIGRQKPRLKRQKSMDFSLLRAHDRRITPPETPTRNDLPSWPEKASEGQLSTSMNRRPRFRSDPDITSIREGEGKHERSPSLDSNQSSGSNARVEATLTRVKNRLRKDMVKESRSVLTNDARNLSRNELLEKRRHKLFTRMKSSPVIKIPPQLIEKPERPDRTAESEENENGKERREQQVMREVGGDVSRKSDTGSPLALRQNSSESDLKHMKGTVSTCQQEDLRRNQRIERWLQQCENEIVKTAEF